MAARLIYFDTNLYSMMADRGDASEVAAWLCDRQLLLVASHQTVLEILAIARVERRMTELAQLKAMARPIETLPLAYRQAMELRRLIRRLHPLWLHPLPNTTSIKRFLRAHKASSRLSLSVRGISEQARTTYREVSLVGIKRAQAAQKQWRKANREAEPTLVTPDRDRWRLDTMEKGWRANCAMSWIAALYERREESRDYADYLLPYLRQELPTAAAFTKLWMDEASADDMPLNRLTGLASYIQLEKTPGQGNAGDVLHAAFLCDVDVFVTGDRDFAFVLDKLAAQTPGAAQVILIDRGKSSTAAALSSALNDYQPHKWPEQPAKHQAGFTTAMTDSD